MRGMYDLDPDYQADFSDRHRYKRDVRGQLKYSAKIYLSSNDKEITTVFGKHISLACLISDGWYYRLKQKKLSVNLTLILTHPKHKFAMKFKAPGSIAKPEDSVAEIIGKVATAKFFQGVHNSATPLVRVVPGNLSNFNNSDLRAELKKRDVREVTFVDEATNEALKEELTLRGEKWPSWPAVNDMSTTELLEIINARLKAANPDWATDLLKIKDKKNVKKFEKVA